MRINEIAEIIHGNLLNNPPLSAFENVTTNLAKVQRGSLFIATTPQSAKEAIALGAYGIVFEDGDMPMIDNEVAWIRVDLLQDAITRFIRFHLLMRNISLIYLSNIEFDIAKEIINDEYTCILDGGYGDLLEVIQRENLKNLILKNSTLLELSLEEIPVRRPENMPFRVISCTLFDSKIYFNSQRNIIPLPSVFLNNLATVIEMCQSQDIHISLEKFEGIPHLKPNFVDSKNHLCKFGQTGRVIIAEEDLNAFKEYSGYILANAKWAKIALFVPQKYYEIFSAVATCYAYSNPQNLLKELERPYNFAIILGVSDDFLLDNLKYQPEVAGLFDD